MAENVSSVSSRSSFIFNLCTLGRDIFSDAALLKWELGCLIHVHADTVVIWLKDCWKRRKSRTKQTKQNKPIYSTRNPGMYVKLNITSRSTSFLIKLDVCSEKTQICLRIRTIWSEYSKSVLWVAKYPKSLQVDSEDSDQPAHLRMLIWVFTGRTYNFVEKAVARLIP